jgi:hypothetical protein
LRPGASRAQSAGSSGAALYAANDGNKAIEQFTHGAVGSVFATTGLNVPTFLAVVAVPEPDTAPFGFTCVGVAALRRRRSAAVAAKLTA